MAERDNYDKQVFNSISSLFELTSRVDERVKLIMENHNKTENKFREITNNQQELIERVATLEAKNGETLKKAVEELDTRLRNIEMRVQTIDIIARGSQSKWDKIIDYGLKILVAIAAAVLTFKLGIGK